MIRHAPIYQLDLAARAIFYRLQIPNEAANTWHPAFRPFETVLWELGTNYWRARRYYPHLNQKLA